MLIMQVMRWVFFASVFVLAGLGPAATAADRQVIADFSTGTNAQGVPQGWELKEKSGRADVALVESDGVKAVQLRSVDTSFSLQREIRVNLKDYPVLTWKWKVNKLPAGGDFRKTKTDDQAAQLFVAFSRTEAIVYLWDSSAPEGLMANAPSPPFIKIKAVVVRSGSSQAGQWLKEERNAYDDYQRLFGTTGKAPVASGMRLQINTQHTRTSGESYFADVAFEPLKAKATANRPFTSSSPEFAKR